MSYATYDKSPLKTSLATLKDKITNISLGKAIDHPIKRLSDNLLAILNGLDGVVFPLFSEGAAPGIIALGINKSSLRVLKHNFTQVKVCLDIMMNGEELSSADAQELIELMGACFEFVHPIAQDTATNLSFLNPSAIASVLSVTGSPYNATYDAPSMTFAVNKKDNTRSVNFKLPNIFDAMGAFLAFGIYRVSSLPDIKARSGIYSKAREKQITEITKMVDDYIAKSNGVLNPVAPVAAAPSIVAAPVAVPPAAAPVEPTIDQKIQNCTEDLVRLRTLLAESETLMSNLATYQTSKPLNQILTAEELRAFPNNGVQDQVLPRIVEGFRMPGESVDLNNIIRLFQTLKHSEPNMRKQLIDLDENQQLLKRFFGVNKAAALTKVLKGDYTNIQLIDEVEGTLKAFTAMLVKPVKLHDAVTELLTAKGAEVNAEKSKIAAKIAAKELELEQLKAQNLDSQLPRADRFFINYESLNNVGSYEALLRDKTRKLQTYIDSKAGEFATLGFLGREKGVLVKQYKKFQKESIEQLKDLKTWLLAPEQGHLALRVPEDLNLKTIFTSVDSFRTFQTFHSSFINKISMMAIDSNIMGKKLDLLNDALRLVQDARARGKVPYEAIDNLVRTKYSDLCPEVASKDFTIIVKILGLNSEEWKNYRNYQDGLFSVLNSSEPNVHRRNGLELFLEEKIEQFTTNFATKISLCTKLNHFNTVMENVVLKKQSMPESIAAKVEEISAVQATKKKVDAYQAQIDNIDADLAWCAQVKPVYDSLNRGEVPSLDGLDEGARALLQEKFDANKTTQDKVERERKQGSDIALIKQNLSSLSLHLEGLSFFYNSRKKQVKDLLVSAQSL